MKKILSLILTLALVVSVFAITAVNTPASGASQYAQTSTSVEGGNILHCMCWSYNTIKANLDDIKAAGYTAVQTSCIQPPKDYNTYDSTKGNVWWHFYQPVDFCVADGKNWLGTKAELTSLCETAHEKGIKIIGDIVANHMANPGSYGEYNGRSKEINKTLLEDESCWHNTGTALSGSDRYDMVMHDNSNLPDLNTGNTKVQTMVRDMLKEAIDCGVDGFRFDAAQNIETPSDATNLQSSFWPNTIGEAKTYASSKGKTLFSYGEVYYDAWGGDAVLNDYINYIGHVTEPNIGMEALGGVQGQDPSRVAAVDYKNNRSASKNVLWVESHDSYYSGTGYGGTQTSSVNNSSVVRAWAIIASRADATALYFARPGNEYVTNATNDTTWKSTAVAEVNKFKNYFRGKSEYLATSGKVAYNERGTAGVVISKLDGAGSVNLTANRMASGTYKDQITGNTFTVSGGKISGTVGSTGVAVVYNPSNTSMTEPTYASSGKILTLKTGVWNADSAWFAAYFYGGNSEATWVRMSGSGSTYTVDAPAGYTNVIFVRMSKNDTSTMDWDNKWNQTNDLTIPASNATYTISGWGSGTDICPGSWSIDATTAPTSSGTAAPTTATSAPTTATAATQAPTASSATTSYYLVGSMTNWAPNASYNFSAHASDDGAEEYKLTVYLQSGVTCKAVKSTDGSGISTWYPDGTGNDVTILAPGWYNFYLRPNGDGHDGWITNSSDSSKKVLYYKTTPVTEPPTSAPTAAPTDAPTAAPTDAPTEAPTDAPTVYKVGDVDGDGVVSIMDATAIQRHLAGYPMDDDAVARGAITDPERGINIVDATAIQRKIAGYPDPYGIGEFPT